MRIIPAIDLKNGCVVRARGGDRRRYQPLNTPAFPSPDLSDVVRALHLDHDLFYIADLDRICGDGGHDKHLRALKAALPRATLWLDNGIRDADDCRKALDAGLGQPVVGSETLADIAALRDIARTADEYILSLDFFQRRLRGPAKLLEKPESWPRTVIVLALHAVGENAGPDLRLCGQICALAHGRRVVYGGGVRNGDDLRALENAGVNAALVSGAIYDGAI